MLPAETRRTVYRVKTLCAARFTCCRCDYVGINVDLFPESTPQRDLFAEPRISIVCICHPCARKESKPWPSPYPP
jgi:hypothetical protein